MEHRGVIDGSTLSDLFTMFDADKPSGVVRLKAAGQEVVVQIRHGCVVRADSSARPRQMMLGGMLVAAGVLRREDLDEALRLQARTLERLGTVLVDLAVIDPETLSEFAHLQVKETVVRLFLWDKGRYLFEPGDTEPPADGMTPIPPDEIRQQGLQMQAEWPELRGRLPAYSTGFAQARPLPVVPTEQEPGFAMGSAERAVWDLLSEPRTVEALIHRSRLGELRAGRAVVNLLEGGYIAEAPRTSLAPEPPPEPHGVIGLAHPGQVLIRAATYLALIGLAVFMVRSFDASWFGLYRGRLVRARSMVAHHHVATTQMRVVRRALEVYRLRHGDYPDALQVIVDEGIVRDHDIRYPYRGRYYYRRNDDTYVLLRPLR